MNDNVFETGLEMVNVPLFRAVRTINGKPADENGNYELPVPDSQKPADWNQNDATAPDYIKNRPFYGEKEGIAETITTEDGGGYGYGEIAGELLLEAGKTYTVTLDGTKYECKAYTIGNSDRADAYAALGNSALAVQEMPEAVNYPPATDEPFAIVDWGGGDLSLYTEATGTYAVELGEKGSFARLDEKYLPLTVLLATAQQLTEAQQEQVRENIGVGKGGGNGEDGFSPIATVERTETGAVITITDKTGTTEAEIKDGKDGASIAYVEDMGDGTMEVYSTDGRLLGVIQLPKGPMGDPGEDGEDGVSPSVSISKTGKVTTVEITDADGTQTATINDGADGKDGQNGKDGVSATHSWNGTTLTVTSASGTSSANLKGDKGDTGAPGADGAKGDKGDKGETGATGAQGDPGKDGADGKDGTSVTVKSVSESTADGGSNVVTFSDGKTLTVKNGSKGDDGVGIAYVEDLEDGRMEVWGTNQKLLGTIVLPQAEKGDPGDAGFSPAVEVKKSGKVTTVTITDKDGEKNATINDGEDGVGIASVDDPGDGTAEFFGTNGEILGVVTLPKGKDGEDGEDGVSPTVGISKSGKVTTIEITDADGTQTATINDGADGKDGTSVTVKSVSESATDGGSNVVTFSDGKTATIKNGSKGSAGTNGTNGKDGKTPVKGTDYFTPADQEAIVQQVIAALGTPVFGRVDADNNIILTGELTDGTYKLWFEGEDGKLSEICDYEVGGGIENLANPSSADWKENYRINSSGALAVGDAGGNIGIVNAVTNFIPCKAGDVVRVKGMDIAYYQTSLTDVGRTNMWYYQSDKSTSVGKIVVADAPNVFVNSGDVWTFTVGNGLSGDTSKIAYIRPFGRYVSGYTKNDVIITVNEEII